MRQKFETGKLSSERVVKDIRRATRKQYSAEEKIRVVPDGLRGEHSGAPKAAGCCGLMLTILTGGILAADRRATLAIATAAMSFGTCTQRQRMPSDAKDTTVSR